MELFFVKVALLRTTHNLMQFYSQNICNSDINNFVSTLYLTQWDIKAKQLLSGKLYDVITTCVVVKEHVMLRPHVEWHRNTCGFDLRSQP